MARRRGIFPVRGDSLREVLRREGEAIVCPELATSYSPKAA